MSEAAENRGMGRLLLIHRSGARANQVHEYSLQGSLDLLIGRDPAAEIQYHPEQDDVVGRRHARITVDPGGGSVSVEDLNSRNGTYLNGQRVEGRAPLQPGDILQFGPGGPELELQIETPGEPTQAPAPEPQAVDPPTPPPPEASAPRPWPPAAGRPSLEAAASPRPSAASAPLSPWAIVIAVAVFLIIAFAAFLAFGGWTLLVEDRASSPQLAAGRVCGESGNKERRTPLLAPAPRSESGGLIG